MLHLDYIYILLFVSDKYYLLIYEYNNKIKMKIKILII